MGNRTTKDKIRDYPEENRIRQEKIELNDGLTEKLQENIKRLEE